MTWALVLTFCIELLRQVGIHPVKGTARDFMFLTPDQREPLGFRVPLLHGSHA